MDGFVNTISHAEMWHENSECLFHYSSQIIVTTAVCRHLSLDNPSSMYDQDYVVGKIMLQKMLVLVQQHRNYLFKMSHTMRVKCAGDPSCCNHIFLRHLCLKHTSIISA